MSHPNSRSYPNEESEPGLGHETIYWDSLPVFFSSEMNLYLWVYKHIQKNYHRSGVHQNLYTYTKSHLHIQNYTFTFTN